MIVEHRFRALCRKEQGGIEGEKFQKALDASKADPLPVSFEVGIDEERTIEIPREVAEFYAKIAKEERKEEDELLKHIKPEAHTWVKHNRTKMIEKLREAMLESLTNGRSLTLIWPLWTPDVVPFEVAQGYVRKYG